MNTTIAPSVSTKIAVKSIHIDRVEGLTSECFTTGHATWVGAEERIQLICATSPDDGCYNKCKFTIVWADGEVYEGRYDAAREGSHSYEGTLAKHCLDFLTFRAGLRCPDHMAPDDYDRAMQRQGNDAINEALRYLKTYSFVDIMVTPQQARELLAMINAPEGPTVPEGASAKDSAEMHRAYVAKHNTNMLPVVGNSYPVKNVLYAWGGRWDGTAKTWLVPAYKHVEAQAMVDQHTKPVAATAAPAPKPAPVVAPAPKPKAAPAKPVKKGYRTPIQKRYDALLVGMELLLKDMPIGFVYGALDRCITDLKDNQGHV